jgi:hypothetical protein
MMNWMTLAWLPLVAVATVAAAPADNPGALDDYPTAARADYVLACVAVNGGTRDALDRCSCSIDVISSILPYKQYEEAATVLSLRQGAGGYLADELQAPPANEMVRALREAQAEGEVRCF